MSFSKHFTKQTKNGIYHMPDVAIQVEPVPSHQAISAQQTHMTSKHNRINVDAT